MEREDHLFEELCKKGKAYRAKRMRAGEKSSTYLSGRAVKVCKGQMQGESKEIEENVAPDHDGKAAPYGSGYERVASQVKESLRDWFKKEKWKRIDTQGNIAGDCGTMPKGKKTQRCLPQAKAQSLTKKQRAATSRKKTASNKQFVSNTKSAKYRKKSN